jgi:hypothetical protein
MNLSTDVIPIRINVPFQKFIDNYKLAKLSNDYTAKQYLLNALDSQFKSWDNLFDTGTYEQDITLLTLFKTLAKDDRPKDLIENKLSNLKFYFKYYSFTFYDYCVEAFLLHLKKDTIVYSTYSNPKKFFYFLSNEIKHFLFKLLRKILQEYKRDYYTNPSYFYFKKISNDNYLDVNLLNKIQKENILLFSAYLFFLVNQSFSDYILRDKYKLSIKQSKKLNEDLCHLIKTLLLNN